MPGLKETERLFDSIPEVLLEAEPVVEILGPVMERGNKYGPLGEPSFRRPA